jgi:hypothetical protein
MKRRPYSIHAIKPKRRLSLAESRQRHEEIHRLVLKSPFLATLALRHGFKVTNLTLSDFPIKNIQSLPHLDQ